jgi:type IV secretion system protein TrbL
MCVFLRCGKLRQHHRYCAGALLLLVVGVCAVPAFAQSSVPSQILQQYRNERVTWSTNVWPYANSLFGILAVIEFAWSAAVMLLEKSDLQSWTAALVRKIMWLGAFYALLLNGRTWIPAIIDSFEIIGEKASGVGGLSPSGVFSEGLNIAGSLMGSASTSAFFTNPGTSIALVVAAALTVIAFVAVTIQFIVAMVESYIIVAAGFVFLGFGGSRWTAPYVERYIALGVSTGVKIMLLYLLIGTGMDLAGGWQTMAAGVGSSPTPAMSAFEVMGAALIFMMLCWQIPKLFAAVLGGSPALTGGDLVSTVTTLGSAAMMVGAGALAGAGLLAGGARAAAAGGAAAGGSSGGAAGLLESGGNAPVQPPPPSGGGTGGRASGSEVSSKQPPPPKPVSAGNGATSSDTVRVADSPAPPSNAASNGSASDASAGSSAPATPASTMPASTPPVSSGSAPTTPQAPARSGTILTKAASRFRRGAPRPISLFPSDAAPHATPPRMNIDHHE